LLTMTRASSAAPADQRVTLHGVSWRSYELLLEERQASKGVRLAYLEGELELMSPSREHEVRAEMIGLLLMAWAEVSGVSLQATGSWTVRQRREQRGIEADKSYVVGAHKAAVPDLAIQVVWTRGGLDKLDIYRGLGVKEVWFWEDRAFAVHVLGPGGYACCRESALLYGIDLGLLARFVEAPDQIAALKSFRAALG
jgi:Uma2 family endonuclease